MGKKVVIKRVLITSNSLIWGGRIRRKVFYRCRGILVTCCSMISVSLSMIWFWMTCYGGLGTTPRDCWCWRKMIITAKQSYKRGHKNTAFFHDALFNGDDILATQRLLLVLLYKWGSVYQRITMTGSAHYVQY